MKRAGQAKGPLWECFARKGLEEARSLIHLKSCMGRSEAGEAGSDCATKFGFYSKSNAHFKKGEVT